MEHWRRRFSERIAFVAEHDLKLLVLLLEPMDI